jgi:hypothetical protein
MKRYLPVIMLSLASVPAWALSGAEQAATPQFCYGGSHATIQARALRTGDVVIDNATPKAATKISGGSGAASRTVRFKNLMDGSTSTEKLKQGDELVRLDILPGKRRLGCRYSANTAAPLAAAG